MPVQRPEHPLKRINKTGCPEKPVYDRKQAGWPTKASLLDSKEEQNQKADALLEELGIRRLSDQKAGVLSGGERRRLEISRALATDPGFILLDEPFAGIDPLAVIDIQNIIAHLSRRRIGILISDHNVRETLGVCDKAYILNNGVVIEAGGPDQIAQSPVAREIYLGEKFRL